MRHPSFHWAYMYGFTFLQRVSIGGEVITESMQGQVMAFHYCEKKTILTPLSKIELFLDKLSVVKDSASRKTLQKNYEKTTN